MRLSFSSLFSKIKKSSFVKNILVVMTGTALAQVIGLVLTPIISRLFSPSDFGISGSFSAIHGVIAAGVTLEYSQAIMLPKEKEDAINLLSFALICTFAITLMCLAFCLVMPATVNSLMKTKGSWALGLLVLATLVTGINQLCQAWAVRAKAFTQTSASQVIRSVSSNGARIPLGYLKGGAQGLIISTILGNVLASINLVRVVIPDLSALRSGICWSRMKQLAKDYRDFPMYSASQNVTNALSQGLPVLLLTHYYGIPVAGAYAFGISALQLPLSFLTTALRQVLFQKTCETQHHGGSIATLYVKTTTTLFFIALFPCLALLIWAPQLFAWVFGSQWHVAGELARSLIIWLAIAFCNLPAVLFARIIRIQRFVFFYDLALLSARSLALVLGGLLLNAYQTVMIFALIGAFMNIFLILYVGHAVMIKEGPVNIERIRDILID